MAKISDEEFAELEQERRHEELIQAVQKIQPPDTKPLESLLKQNLDALTALLKRDVPPVGLSTKLETVLEKGLNKKGDDLTALVKTLSNGIAELGKARDDRPKTFKVIRNQYGFIDEIVLEGTSEL